MCGLTVVTSYESHYVQIMYGLMICTLFKYGVTIGIPFESTMICDAILGNQSEV